MITPILASILIAALSSGATFMLMERRLGSRVKNLERDLQCFSEAMCQMAEIQMKGYQKLSGDMSQIEERVLELAIPSSDSRLPLERRHQVLTLARNGIAIEEIVKRLNLPRGEAELILNLQKYTDAATPRPARTNVELRSHV